MRLGPLHRVAVAAQQLKVLYVVGAAPGLGYDVVNGEVLEREQDFAAGAILTMSNQMIESQGQAGLSGQFKAVPLPR